MKVPLDLVFHCILFYFFYSWFHLYGYCLLHIPTLVSPFLSCFPARGLPPWECDRSHSLLCCIAFVRGHRKTAENLCRYGRPFHTVCPQSIVSEKMISRSAFRYAGRGLAVTNPSTDPAPSCLTCVIAWCRTPTTHRKLSVIPFYLLINSKLQIYFQKNSI